jgi:DNA-binding SARP family transcriptional activator/tetratricopeptide (TPR) repeat protein
LTEVKYHRQYRRCGKPNCRPCTEGRGHGPYWYAYTREGGRLRGWYIGKELPPGVSASGDEMPVAADADGRDKGDPGQDKSFNAPPVPVPTADVAEAPPASTARPVDADSAVPGRVQVEAGLSIWMLGRFHVERGGVPIEDWRRQSAVSVLKRLLLADQRRLSREYLAQQLFPTTPTRVARAKLAAAVHALRVALEPALVGAAQSRYLVQEGETLELRLGSVDWIDLLAFEQALHEVECSGGSVARLEAAAALYGGDLLPEETAEWCLAPRQALQLRRHGLLLSLAEAQVLESKHEAALVTLTRLLTIDPTHEEAGRRLMALLDRRGRRAEALRVYQALKRALRRELHACPAPETETLAAALRAGENAPRRRPNGLTHPDMPAPAAPRAVAPLVGRAEHLALLRAALLAARDGLGRSLLLTGEAGIGKTRLAEEAATIAAAHGFTVLWGRAGEGERHLPYMPIIEALRAYTRARPPRALRRELQDAQALVALLPELAGGLFGLAPPPPLGERPAERQRLWTAVTAMLAAAAESRPVLLILDDLHWADEATIGLLTFLVRRCRESRLLLLGTLREDPRADHPLRRLALEGTRDGSLELAPLSGLLPSEVAALVAQRLGAPLPPDQIAALHTQCNGNPFFIGELAALLREQSAGGSGLTLPAILAGEGALPGTVRQTLTRRLDRLGNACRALLRAGAVIGGRFTEDLLAAVVEQEVSVVEDALDEAVSAGLVREGALAEGGGYVLVHALVRRALYEELMPGQRRRLHGRIAALLVQKAPNGSESLDLIAYHYARTHEHLLAAQWLERAGDKAAGFFAHATAIRHYTQARDHLSTGDQGGPIDEAKRCALARVAEKLGDLRLIEGEFAAAQEDFARARALAVAPDRRAELWRKEGLSWQQRGEYDRALSAFDHALQPSTERAGEAALPATILAALEVSRGEVHFKQGDFGAAEAAARRGLAMLHAEPEGFATAQAHGLLGNVAAARGDLTGAEEYHLRSLAAYERHQAATGERHVATCWSNLARVSYRKGDLAHAADRLRRGMEVLERIGDHHGVATCLNQLGLVARRRGAPAEADMDHRRSLAIRERIGDQHGVASCWNNLGLVALDQGHYARAEEYFRLSLPIQERIGDQLGVAYAWNNLGHVAFRQAEYARAQEQYRQALALYERLGDEQAIAYCRVDLGAVALYRGSLDQAGKLLGAALAGFERIGDQEGLASAWTNLGALEAAIGKADAAAVLCRRARRLARRQAIPAEEALAALGEAEAYVYQSPLNPRRLRISAALIGRAQALARTHGWALTTRHVLLLTAELQLRQGDLGAARAAAMEVLRLAEIGQARREASLARRLLGECTLEAGDRGAAAAELRAALEAQWELGLRLDAERTSVVLAKALTVHD